MKNLKDLSGLRFGMLTVIERGEDYITPNGKKLVRWVCKCDCGNKVLVRAVTLSHGNKCSCGCYKPPRKGLDITGKQFGRLTAIEVSEYKKGEGYIWRCKCECGKESFLPVKRLMSGKVNSCGCLRDEKIAQVNAKHNKSKHSRLYNVWVGMRQRCNDPNHKSYANYGGRGIKVCDEWNDFTVFEKWAVANGYDEDAPYGECTIDRVDVDSNYQPDNCRWVDLSTQANNKRNSRINA